MAYFFLFDPPTNLTIQKPSISAVFKNKSALMTTSAYALLGFAFTMFEECLPLWYQRKNFFGSFHF